MKLLNKKTKRSINEEEDEENDENINKDIILIKQPTIPQKDKYFPTHPNQDDLSNVKIKQKYLTLNIFSFLNLNDIESLFTSLPNSYFNTHISTLLFNLNITLHREHRFILGNNKIKFFNFTTNNYSNYFRFYHKKTTHKISTKVNFSLYNPIQKEIYGINKNCLYIGNKETNLLNKDILDKINPLSHFHFINNYNEIALFAFQSTIFISINNETKTYDHIPISASYVVENKKRNKFLFSDVNGSFHIYTGNKDNIQQCQFFKYSISYVSITNDNNEELFALYSTHDQDCNDIKIYNIEIKEIVHTIVPSQKIKKLFYHNCCLIGISEECIFYWKKEKDENEYKETYAFNYKEVVNDEIYFITYAEDFLSFSFVLIVEENDVLVSKLLLLNIITNKYEIHTLEKINFQLPTLYTQDSFFYCVSTTSKSNKNKRKLYIYSTDCELSKANSLCLQIFTFIFQN